MEEQQEQQNRNENRNEHRQSRQVFFIIAIFIMFTFMTNTKSEDQNSDRTSAATLIQLIKNPLATQIDLSIVINYLENRQIYEGHWKSTNPALNSLFTKEAGKYKMIVVRSGHSDNYEYRIEMSINNGEYIDDGNVILERIEIEHSQWQTVKEQNKLVIRQKILGAANSTVNASRPSNSTANASQPSNNSQSPPNNESISIKADPKSPVNGSHNLTIRYQLNQLLKEIETKAIQIKQYQIVFAHNVQKSTIDVSFLIGCEIFALELGVERLESKTFQVILYSIILFVISFAEISGIMRMYKGIFEGTEIVTNFSWVTILILTLWDAVMSIITFFEAFAQNNLILFILQAFIFFFLFLNLELRLILMIFQANSQGSSQEIVCKFNCLSYGSIILIYPLMYYVNLNDALFIAVSMCLLPQILLNGQISHRPNLQSSYYRQLVPFRFLIILYLRSFPYNVYELEPNYSLGLLCVGMLVCQYSLLWAQRKYGPRKVLPSFFLPKIYNYQCEIDFNVEENSEPEECVICLSYLHMEPGQIPDRPPNSPQVVELSWSSDANHNNSQVRHDSSGGPVPYRVMKSPCGHKYHGKCLTQWMSIKMECPQCRTKLPPFE